MNRAAPEPKANMGQPVPRLEARRKVTGQARYASDIPVSQPAFGFLITSAIAKGRITAMDVSEARAVPGVIEIFTHENTGELKNVKYSAGGGGPTTSIQEFGPEILHDGQIIGMVVADKYEAGREAAYKVKVSYNAETPSAGFDTQGVTMKPDKKPMPSAGDAAAAFETAAVKLEAEYEMPAQHHNPIELFTTTAVWNGDELTLYEPSQFMYGLKNNAAHKLGIDPDRVHALSPYVGGAFGAKAQLTPRTGLVALAAKKIGRPVKLVATRDQGFTIATYRAETRHKIKMGATQDGKILSFEHQGWEVTSRPDDYSVAGVEDSARLYGYGAVKTGVTLVHADRNTPGFMRSPPVVPYIYALESAMDEMAIKLNMDPIDFRRVNDSMQDATGKPWSSRSLMQCYDEAAAKFGWSKRSAEPGSMRDGDWLIGWGCASAVYPTHIGAAAARVKLNAEGRAVVQVAAHEIGTGVITVVGQTAAERLGIPLENVQVEVGDSNYPPVPVAGGSNQTASICNVVAEACDALLAKLGNRQPETTGSAAGVQDLRQGFARLGVSTLEEYSEFVPDQAKPKPGAESDQEAVRRHADFGRRFQGRQADVRAWRQLRRGAGAKADPRNPRPAHGRRLRRRPHHEHAHRAQPVYGRHDLGRFIGAARGDRDRQAQRPLRQRQPRRLPHPGERRYPGARCDPGSGNRHPGQSARHQGRRRTCQCRRRRGGGERRVSCHRHPRPRPADPAGKAAGLAPPRTALP